MTGRPPRTAPRRRCAWPSPPTPSPRPLDAPTTSPAPPRLGNGALRDLVRRYLAERPGQEFTPHQIAKALGGRSAGTVSNTLTSKAVQHDIIQTSSRPRRYMIAPEPNDSAGSAEAH